MDKLNNVYVKENDKSSSGEEEYNIDENEININEYEPADQYEGTVENEFKNYVNVINIFTCYYKQTFNINQKITIFDDIPFDDKTATNKCMEFIFGEIYRYEKSNIFDKDVLYNPDDDINMETYKELYCLMIDSEPVYISPFVLPLISYLANMEWININWSIIDILQ
jgi:hypothetical protein